MEPIFIPTKKRFDNCSFIKLLQEQNISAYIVVEPEDYLQYLERYPLFNYLILPLSNKGITYVRNYIKGYARNKGYKYYWMVDDDVTNVYMRSGTQLIKLPLTELPVIGTELKLLPNAAICSLEYRQFAWSSTKPFVKDSFCDSFVFINTELTGNINYDNEVEGKEDRDFAMQCIRRGYNTYRTTLFAFSAPPNGSNKGGLKEIFYDCGKEELCALNMVKKWGESVCQKIIKNDGRHDIKIHWNNINKVTLFS